MKDEDSDYLFKILVIGDASVGKSCLLTRFTRNAFNERSSATIGVDFGTKNVEIGGKVITAQLWDSAGQERFRAVSSAYYRGAVGAMLVYDVTSKVTFKNVGRWLTELREMAEPNIMIMMVGNKSDMETQREVTIQEATAFATANNVSFVEASALSGQGVTQAFEDLLRTIYDTVSNKPLVTGSGHTKHSPSPRGTVIVEEDPPKETKEPNNTTKDEKPKSGCPC